MLECSCPVANWTIRDYYFSGLQIKEGFRYPNYLRIPVFGSQIIQVTYFMDSLHNSFVPEIAEIRHSTEYTPTVFSGHHAKAEDVAKLSGERKVEEKMQAHVCVQNYANKIRQQMLPVCALVLGGSIIPDDRITTIFPFKKATTTNCLGFCIGSHNLEPISIIHAWTK